MTETEQVLSELRSLRKQLTGVVRFSQLPQAMPYPRAAFELGIGLTELKVMIKLGMIRTVSYGPGKRPKVPLDEVRRLTTLSVVPEKKQRGKPSKKRAAGSAMSPEELAERIKRV